MSKREDFQVPRDLTNQFDGLAPDLISGMRIGRVPALDAPILARGRAHSQGQAEPSTKTRRPSYSIFHFRDPSGWLRLPKRL